MKKLKVVEVLQYNDVNMKVISTKRTTVKMGLLHYNTHVVWLPFWAHKLLMSLKSRASGEVPRASKIWGLLAQRARWNSNIFRALLVYCFGSFLLQDSSPSIFFWGTKYEIYCECVAYSHSVVWRRAWLWLELFASTAVGRFLSQLSYLSSYIFLRRRRSFTSRKLQACLEKF